MGAGLVLGGLFPALRDGLHASEIGGISVPIALGLFVMMYPPLAKVRYDEALSIAADRRLMGVSLVLNWIVCRPRRETGLRPLHLGGIHGGREQLRTRDCRRYRYFWCRLRSSIGRYNWSTDRSSGTRCPRVRPAPDGPASLSRRRHPAAALGMACRRAVDH